MNFENVEKDSSLEVRKTNSAMKMAGLFFFLVMLLEIPLSFVVSILGQIIPEEYSVLTSVLITQGYLLGCAMIFALVTKQSWKNDLWMRKCKISSFFLSVLVLICATPMATWLNMLSQLFAKNEISNAIYGITKLIPVWLGVLIIGCLPAFVEEFLFRGIIYSAFRKRSALTAIVVSALTFGLMHMNFNQIMYAVYLGVLFALVLEATGSLFSTMLLHMLFNATNTLYVYILPRLYEFLGEHLTEYADMDLDTVMSSAVSKQEILSSLIMVTPTAFIGLFLAILLLRLIAKTNGRNLSWKYLC